MNNLIHDPLFLVVAGIILVSILGGLIMSLRNPNFRFRTPPYYASALPTSPPNLPILTYAEVHALFVRVVDWQPSKWSYNPGIQSSEPIGFVGHSDGIQLNLERDFRIQEPRFVVFVSKGSSLGSYEECPGKFLGPFQVKYEQLVGEWWHAREVAAEAKRLQEETARRESAERAIQAFREKQEGQ